MKIQYQTKRAGRYVEIQMENLPAYVQEYFEIILPVKSFLGNVAIIAKREFNRFLQSDRDFKIFNPARSAIASDTVQFEKWLSEVC